MGERHDCHAIPAVYEIISRGLVLDKNLVPDKKMFKIKWPGRFKAAPTTGIGNILMKPILAFIFSALLVVPFAACSSVSSLSLFSSGSKEDENAAAEPPEKLYNKADTLLTKGKYDDAATKFENVDHQHPYSPYARRAVVMAAYSYYKAGKYPEAIKNATRYTTLHPGTKEAALAHHIIAMSNYDQITDPARDQTRTKAALKALKVLRQRYPKSRYAAEAENRIRIATDLLAASEMNVGRYYLEKHNYLAAINRFKVVVKEYQTTAHVEEALMRLTESYMAMGITNEAQTATAVLGHNFPKSRWYKDSYALLKSGGLEPREDTGSWISRTWRTTIKSVQSVNPL